MATSDNVHSLNTPQGRVAARQHIYWPYDEVRFEYDSATKVFSVKAPWLELKAAADALPSELAERLAEKSAQGQLAGEDLSDLQVVAQKISSYPMCYILPQEPKGAEDVHDLHAQVWNTSSPLDAASGVVEVRTRMGLDDDASFEVWSPWAKPWLEDRRPTWQWDVESALAFAKVGSGVSPQSILSVARRFHLGELLEDKESNVAYASLAQLEGEERGRKLAQLIGQNHYVTQQCQRSLRAGLLTAQSARPAVEAFMKEEDGHDQIIAKALEEVGVSKSDIRVSAQTQMLMTLLQFAGERNFLAFAICIDAFERSSYSKLDPLAQLCEEYGYARAARHIQKHKDINDAGGHEQIALGLLDSMAVVSPDYATEALRLAELLTVGLKGLAASALR